MTKIYMKPRSVDFDNEESGIRRVVESYERYLPEFGYTFVDDPNKADVRIGHAQALAQPDVLICHGLYFTADYERAAPKWEHSVNRELIEAIRYAKHVTVTSSWVREVFQRDMRMSPTIVPHGIDWEEWQLPVDPPSNDYVLWNKNRSGVDVCSTDDMERLARAVPSMLFLSTFANDNAPANVRKIGLQSHTEMSKYVRGATVYLATVKETFGIGILEAMAAGVPVLGWHGGGIEDLVQHGVNGYLVHRGDFDGLKRGLEYCIKNRKVLGENGRSISREYTWEKAVKKLHHVIQSALHDWPTTVSVIIPCFNYGEKVGRAIHSVLEQTRKPEEIIVVDDGSDETNAALTKETCEKYGVVYLRKSNGGVATARNAGIEASMGSLICCLDADDALAPTFLETCVDALAADRSLSIAYTGLTAINKDGEQFLSHWPGEYNYDNFLKRQNQVPTCCVFRVSMWERLGGYNQRYAPTGAGAEDAEFFLRAGAYGFRAKKVTERGLFLYTLNQGHTSKEGYREVDWTVMHPWVKDRQHPFASLATPDNKFAHPVRQYDEPIISVIIPVAVEHARTVRDALDSLEAQTFRKWEAILVFDTIDKQGSTFIEDIIADLRIAYPYARIHKENGHGNGAGWARNRGVEMSRAPLLLFLDADDWLYPGALERLYTLWQKVGGVVYSDYVGKANVTNEFAASARANGRLLDFNPQSGEAVIQHRSAEYDCARAQKQPDPYDMYIWNLITSLTPKNLHYQIGGFDESMESWEDWDYWVRMAKVAVCFTRLPETLVVYRFGTGNRRETGLQQYPHLIQYLQDKYKRSDNVPCSSCGSKNAANPNPAREVAPIEQQVISMSDSDYVLISYDHPNLGQHRVVGMVTKTFYGYRGGGERFYAHRKDVEAQPDIYHIVPDSTSEIASTPEPEAPKPISLAPAEPVTAETSDLQRVPGLTDMIERELNMNGIHTIADLMEFPVDDLTTIKGIGKGRAAQIAEYLEELKKKQ